MWKGLGRRVFLDRSWREACWWSRQSKSSYWTETRDKRWNSASRANQWPNPRLSALEDADSLSGEGGKRKQNRISHSAAS